MWLLYWGFSFLEVCIDSKNIVECLNKLNDISREILERGKL